MQIDLHIKDGRYPMLIGRRDEQALTMILFISDRQSAHFHWGRRHVREINEVTGINLRTYLKRLEARGYTVQFEAGGS